MRATASILHLDLDAFFASAEQRDKPSLRGTPVIVGGVGPRGVVATASYEAREHGVHSAMSMATARRLSPRAAVLAGRFDVYQRDSAVVMAVLRELSPTVEPLSLDEAFVDLGRDTRVGPADIEQLRRDVALRTGGLTCSVGVASSKLMAKVATELAKPDGHLIVEPGTERTRLGPLDIRALPGIGPVTAEQLRLIGVNRIRDLWQTSPDDLVALLGPGLGAWVHRLARGEDERPVVAHRDVKSVSIEDTFAQDLRDPGELARELSVLAERLSRRLAAKGLAGRTVHLKVRLHDFRTMTRSTTPARAVDDAGRLFEHAHALLATVDTAEGVRLLGIGVSGLTTWIQPELFETEPTPGSSRPSVVPSAPAPASQPHWYPGMDVRHDTHGDGWVWGSGSGVVTVRFETRLTPPGPVRSFASDDPALSVRRLDTVDP